MYQITFNTLIKQLADSNSKVIQNLWCDTIGKLFFTCCIDNVAMTAIGPVLPGLHGNQLLGNQSIFDFENWLLALPPSPLRGSSAPWRTDSEFSQASWMSCSQLSAQKYSQAQWSLCHYRRKGGTGVLFSTAATAGCRGLSFMTSKSLFLEEEDKSYFLCFFLQPEWSQTFGCGR